MASRPASRSPRDAAAHLLIAVRLLTALPLAEQEARVAEAIEAMTNPESVTDVTAALLVVTGASLETEQAGDALETTAAAAAAAAASADGENEDVNVVWIHNMTVAVEIEHEVKILLQEGTDTDTLLLGVDSAQSIVDALAALGKQEDLLQGEFLQNQCRSLAILEQDLTRMHHSICNEHGKEAVKDFDEQILFKLRKAFLHRCASIYLLYDGDETNLGEFSLLIRPIYEAAYGKGSNELVQRMAQIRNALMKANIFPQMRSNNAKENQRRGKKRASRKKGPGQSGATSTEEHYDRSTEEHYGATSTFYDDGSSHDLLVATTPDHITTRCDSYEHYDRSTEEHYDCSTEERYDRSQPAHVWDSNWFNADSGASSSQSSWHNPLYVMARHGSC